MYIGFQSSSLQRAEEHLVARVVNPRALVVPDDADRCRPRRIGVGKYAAEKRGEHDDERERAANRPGVRANECHSSWLLRGASLSRSIASTVTYGRFCPVVRSSALNRRSVELSYLA